MVYFDHNATAPLAPEALDAWMEAAQTLVGNPSSPHRIGARAERAMDEVRGQLATVLGCEAPDIVWTSGATEANNMVIHHMAQRLPPESEIWLSAIEHPCVLQSTRHYFPGRHRFIPVQPHGVVDLDWLSRELAEHRPGLIAIMAANNETGVVQPWREILAMCRQYDVPFFCDAVQWIGKRPADGLGGCDFLTGSAHKFGGPKGVGFLKCRGAFNPMMRGGPQEMGRRAGTENVASIVAMGEALGTRCRWLDSDTIQSRLSWRETFESRLVKTLPGARIVGESADRLWNTVSVIMPETPQPVRWVVKLDKAGYAVSTGSACSSGKEEPSHVLSAMGIDACDASRVLRFSSGWDTTKAEWDQLLETLAALVREHAG